MKGEGGKTQTLVSCSAELELRPLRITGTFQFIPKPRKVLQERAQGLQNLVRRNKGKICHRPMITDAWESFLFSLFTFRVN